RESFEPSRSAGDGGCRRRQDFEQDRSSEKSREEGGCARHRRRHCEYVSCRTRPRSLEVAVRTGAKRNRARHSRCAHGPGAGAAALLPRDGVAAKEFKAHAPSRIVAAGKSNADEMILDAGPATIEDFAEHLKYIRTLVWNGPFGAFEMTPFDAATNAAAKLV